MKSKITFAKVANSIAFFLTILINFLANYLPINNISTGEVSANYQNPFTPAGFTFSIWGLIYLLLLLFIIYQFSNNGEIKEKFSPGPYFVLASLANITWLFLWHYHYIYLSMLVILILPLSLFQIFKRIHNYSNYSVKEYLAIKLPFSIYTAWVFIASLANLMVSLVYFKSDWPANFLVISTIAAILLGLYLTIIILDKYQNIAFSLVIVWAYSGIIAAQLSSHQSALVVITTAVLSIIIITVKIIALIFNNFS
ncbi:hypothetical protein LJ207_09190 [Halanaerobium sp. Z-7514]|uniref:Tryptophan-rich sensory protein n=1 Tax=Halanaerobium polyolivorans TaxID=2886943 RepID=A0AAW4X111_9FIRM|nr:tryptophan-rich sensory protein [Halanaerobium polyolivorans]MCC3145496.1 hypothetical protein [Halanaerobium polyolivorans]